MKPLGTITKYYPFLGQDIIQLSDSIMEQAEDYRDYAIRLGEKICADDNVSPLLATYALLHTWSLGIVPSVMKLIQKFGHLEYMKVLRLALSAYDGNRDDYNIFLIEVDSLIETCEYEWIVLNLYASGFG